jgi:hypothetical protein
MRQRLDKDDGRYGQRWQAETGFSMLKRRLTSTVNGRSYWSQCRELPTLHQLLGATQTVQADQGLLISWGGFKQSLHREVPTQFFRTPTVAIYARPKARFTIRRASSTMRSRWAWSLKLSA